MGKSYNGRRNVLWFGHAPCSQRYECEHRKHSKTILRNGTPENWNTAVWMTIHIFKSYLYNINMYRTLSYYSVEFISICFFHWTHNHYMISFFVNPWIPYVSWMLILTTKTTTLMAYRLSELNFFVYIKSCQYSMFYTNKFFWTISQV